MFAYLAALLRDGVFLRRKHELVFVVARNAKEKT